MSILCDKGSENLSKESMEWYESLNIKLLTTSGESPEQNGVCERLGGMIRVMVQKLRGNYPKESGTSLQQLLDKSTLAHNSLANVSGHSPMQVVFGRCWSLPSVLNDTNDAGDPGDTRRRWRRRGISTARRSE